MSHARAAGAFCRTTTEQAPAGYNPSSQGCWTKGAPIAWLWNEHIPYGLAASASRQISLADATRAADNAFAQWSQVDCGGSTPNVVAFDSGPVSASTVSQACDSTPCDPTIPGDYHLITFRDDGWKYDDPANTLALTTVTYGVQSGVLFNAEIEINSHDHTLTVTEPPPPESFDLQAILTHEAGHFLGLAHATDSHSVMYAYYSSGSVQLTADDAAAICAVYPPGSSQKALSCSLGEPGARGAGWFVAVLALLLLAALRAVRRCW
jgi:hypothetical protein